MISREEKQEIFKTIGVTFGKGESDTGSSAVQVALLSKRISNLMEHFAAHKKDVHSHRGLMKMIGKRRSLLKYVQKQSDDSYKKLIKELGLRK